MILNQFFDDFDFDVVMGEVWFLECLIEVQFDDDMLFFIFDNVLEEGEGEEEGCGFVEYEMELICLQFMMILVEDSGFKIKVEVLLVLIIFVYECISLEFIEILGIMFEE